MKEIKAYIKPHKLPSVVLALHKIAGLTGMTIVNVEGFGRGRGKQAPHHDADDLVDYVPHVKLEIVCMDELAEEVVSAIAKNAHTGLRGDGKIYVATIDEAVRISSGERGEAAV